MIDDLYESDVSVLDVSKVRQDFPILQQTIHGKPLIYLDNAATSQKPHAVLSAMTKYYQADNANIHRGVHALSVRATESYENARQAIARFINAKHAHEIIFVRGATEAINLVATCFARLQLQSGDEIILSTMEHHSNIVPWQLVAKQYGVSLKVIHVTDKGELDLQMYETLFTEKTKLLAVNHVSNAIGTINPIENMVTFAHQLGVPVLVDGAQGIVHLPVDVQQLDCDFYVFSGHKMYGPTGIGVLYAKAAWLEKLPPYQGGGDMIAEVSFDETHFNKLPYKFEAGTPNIAGVIGLGAAIEYLNHLGMDLIAQHEKNLLIYATEKLQELNDIRLIGTATQKTGVISFVMKDIHPHDIGTVLDHDGIAIRAGHHCAMPLMARFNVPATARISFALYNTFEEIDVFVESLYKVKRLFS